MLLFNGHLGWVLVRIPMKSDFMACVSDHCTLFGEGLERMAWNVPSRLDIVLIKKFEKSANANSSCIQAPRNITRRVFSPVRAKPASDSIYIDGDTTESP